MFDVLLYLFENYFCDDPHASRDRDDLQAAVIQAGFKPSEVAKAFQWLDDAAARRIEFAHSDALLPSDSLRVYSQQEIERLDVEGRGFLMFLCHNGVLDRQQHECVIDRAMALEIDCIDLDDLRWVVLLVLINQPDQEAAYAWMETYLFDDACESIH
ncbi:MAG TPA: DUF494 domain-containing protein [Chiayiivirga sp.]|nr:DUF494 domain-containing protein [Chiayiivirga sp.]